MRNIKFDESTVMREFARIAHEKQFIKTAETTPIVPPAVPAGSPITQPVKMTPEAQKMKEQAEKQTRDKALVDKFKDFVVKSPQGSAQSTDDNASDLPVEVPQAPWVTALEQTNVLDLPSKADLKLWLGPGGGQALPRIKTILDKVKSRDANLYKVLEPKIQEAQKKTSAVEKPELVAEADCYDVTGETGKDLIDSAHPGKMHTEITHRKDDDGNLVETVVEQQETDVEVAHSAPKGTYAALMSLYEKLNKLGHKDVLPELEEAIKLVATPEEVVKYQLLSLANKLDEKGFLDVADKVDQLIKKARNDWQQSETYPDNPYLPPKPSEPVFKPSGPMSRMPGTEPTWPPQPGQAAGQQPGIAQPGIAQPGIARPGIAQPSTQSVDNATMKFQKQYNEFLKKHLLREDGVRGPKTQEAWERYNRKKAPAVAPATPPPPPAPPPVPGSTPTGTTTPLAPATGPQAALSAGQVPFVSNKPKRTW